MTMKTLAWQTISKSRLNKYVLDNYLTNAQVAKEYNIKNFILFNLSGVVKSKTEKQDGVSTLKICRCY